MFQLLSFSSSGPRRRIFLFVLHAARRILLCLVSSGGSCLNTLNLVKMTGCTGKVPLNYEVIFRAVAACL